MIRCLDTYALIELHNGNQKFTNLLNEKCVITDITMAECYGWLYQKHNLQTADFWHRKLSALCVPVPREIMLKAVRFRIDNKKENLSFFDCVGYVFARENNMRFVTGDREFKDKEGVEFIKKE